MHYRLCAYRGLNQKINELEREATTITLGDRLSEIFAVTEERPDRNGNMVPVAIAKTVDIYGGGKFIGQTTKNNVQHDHVIVDTGVGTNVGSPALAAATKRIPFGLEAEDDD